MTRRDADPTGEMPEPLDAPDAHETADTPTPETADETATTRPRRSPRAPRPRGGGPAATKAKPKAKPKKKRKANTDHHNPNRVGTGEHGRPAYVPSEHDIEQVAALAGYGMAVEKIAHVLGISKQTFYDNMESFSDALEKGKAMAEAQVGRSLFEQARSGSLGHIVWYEKTRLGKTDRVLVQQANADGTGPVEHEVKVEGTVNMNGVIGIYLPDNGRTTLGDEIDEADGSQG